MPPTKKSGASKRTTKQAPPSLPNEIIREILTIALHDTYASSCNATSASYIFNRPLTPFHVLADNAFSLAVVSRTFFLETLAIVINLWDGESEGKDFTTDHERACDGTQMYWRVIKEGRKKTRVVSWRGECAPLLGSQRPGHA